MKNREIVIIAAMAENRVIGKDNALPWSIAEDMARFRELTRGWPCVMGRKTWESLPRRPLPGRLNIVVSRSTDIAGITHAVQVAPSLQEAVARCTAARIYICGGAAIYREALPLADRIELTVIHRNYEGDAYFPEIDGAQWEQTARNDFDTFSFISYTRKILL